MGIRVVPGEIAARDATTRTILPTTVQAKWPPFERVAETIATPRRRFPAHHHAEVEVLTYIIEGNGSYEYEKEPGRPVDEGSVQLLAAPSTASHVINPGKGQTVRWFAVVATLPKGSTVSPRVQFGHAPDSGALPDSTIVHSLVGPGTPVQSSLGLECSVIGFVAPGTAFRRIGRANLGVCYALSGQGEVDNAPLEGGEAALVEDSAGIAIRGEPGFRLVVVQAPRPP